MPTGRAGKEGAQREEEKQSVSRSRVHSLVCKMRYAMGDKMKTRLRRHRNQRPSAWARRQTKQGRRGSDPKTSRSSSCEEEGGSHPDSIAADWSPLCRSSGHKERGHDPVHIKADLSYHAHEASWAKLRRQRMQNQGCKRQGGERLASAPFPYRKDAGMSGGSGCSLPLLALDRLLSLVHPPSYV